MANNITQTPTVINVYLKKVGALYYASSPQVAGLHVCGKTEDDVIADVPAIAQNLLEAKLKRKVTIVQPAATDFKPSKKVQRFHGLANFLAIPREACVAA
jgi:hypothetical protein